MQLRAAGGIGTDGLLPFEAELSAGDKMTVTWLRKRKTKVDTGVSDVSKICGSYCRDPLTWALKVRRTVQQAASVLQNVFLSNQGTFTEPPRHLCAEWGDGLCHRNPFLQDTRWVPTMHLKRRASHSQGVEVRVRALKGQISKESPDSFNEL